MADGPRIVIAGWAGAGNTGDELLTAWAVSEVRSAGGRPIVLSVDPADTTRRHGVESVKAMSPASAWAILRADGLVVGPGGILQDSTSIWSLPAHCTRPVLARLSRTPIVGAGLGAGPITRRGSTALLRSALSGADRIVVRDEPSALTLREHRLNAETAPDAVFAAAPRLFDRREVSPDRIVVSLRMTEAKGTVKINRYSEISPDVDAWVLALADLRRQLGVPIRFVSFDPGRDNALHARLAEKVGDCEIVAVDNTTAPAEMARAMVTVTGRYHAAVLSAAYARPLVAIDQGAKLPALAAHVGAGSALVAANVSARILCDAVDRAMAGAADLATTAVRLADEAAAHGDAIREMVGSVI